MYDGPPRPSPSKSRALPTASEDDFRLLAHIAADGSVGKVVIETSSGNPVADAEAVQAVRTWRAVPTDPADELFATVVRLPVVFKLSR